MKIFQCRDFLKIKNVVLKLAECEEFGHKFEVNEVFWQKVEEVVFVLKPIYNLTIEMQCIGYGLADLYIGWLRVEKNLKRILNDGTQFDLAEKLEKHMKMRAPSLFKTPLMLCAVYLDPRIMFKLNDQQKASAAMDLTKICKRLKEANHSNKEEHMNDTLDEIQNEYQTQQRECQDSTSHLLQEMSIYETERAYNIRASVMEFWTENGQKYSQLLPLANILHAVPSNQSRVEASFSSFSYIRSKHRMSMHPQNTSNVLMVRLNKNIFYKLREERIKAILSK